MALVEAPEAEVIARCIYLTQETVGRRAVDISDGIYSVIVHTAGEAIRISDVRSQLRRAKRSGFAWSRPEAR